MQATYGINLGEALYGTKPLGGRRLWVLIKGLGPDSALAWEIRVNEEIKQANAKKKAEFMGLFPPNSGDIVVDVDQYGGRVVESATLALHRDLSSLPSGPYRREAGGRPVPGSSSRGRLVPGRFKDGTPDGGGA